MPDKSTEGLHNKLFAQFRDGRPFPPPAKVSAKVELTRREHLAEAVLMALIVKEDDVANHAQLAAKAVALAGSLIDELSKRKESSGADDQTP